MKLNKFLTVSSIFLLFSCSIYDNKAYYGKYHKLTENSQYLVVSSKKNSSRYIIRDLYKNQIATN